MRKRQVFELLYGQPQCGVLAVLALAWSGVAACGVVRAQETVSSRGCETTTPIDVSMLEWG